MERAKKLNNRGMTLVELVVSFALLGIIMVAGAQLIATSSQIYYYSREQSVCMEVSEMVVDVVRGKLQRANQMLPQDDAAVIIAGGNVQFVDDGKAAKLGLKTIDGRNVLAEELSDGETEICLPIESYMGLSIEEMKFTWLKDDGYPEYMIKMDLKLSGDTNGEYSVSEYISLEYLKRNTERITGD